MVGDSGNGKTDYSLQVGLRPAILIGDPEVAGPQVRIWEVTPVKRRSLKLDRHAEWAWRISDCCR